MQCTLFNKEDKNFLVINMKLKIDQIRTYDDAGFRRRAACLCFKSDCEREVSGNINASLIKYKLLVDNILCTLLKLIFKSII